MANVNFAKWVQMKGRHANQQIQRRRMNGSFPWMERPPFVWELEVSIGDFVAESDMSQDLDLDALYTSSPFIDDVWLEPGAHVVPVVAFAGGVVDGCTVSLGDAGDPDALVTSSSVFTGVTIGDPIATPAAAEYALRPETGFLPQLRIDTTTGNIDDLTAGTLLIRIPFTPFREVG